METYTVTVKTKVAACCDRGKSSYALDNVQLHPRAGLAIATDGRAAAFVDVDVAGAGAPPDAAPVLVPGALFRAPAKKAPCVIELNGAARNVKTNVQLPLGEGRFPDPLEMLRDVPPPAPSSCVVCLDAQLLAQLAESLGQVDDRKVTLTIDTAEPGRAIIVSGARGVGLLMPCRADDSLANPAAAHERLADVVKRLAD